MHDRDLTAVDIAKLKSVTELMNLEWAPCRNACPVHADVRSYIELAGQAKWLESADVIREQLPFATVCGRICHHPCEANCRRNEVDKPIAIREVKRFVVESVGTGATVHKAKKQDKAKVAIIGSGPAGMSAALELAKKGYRPVIFEKASIGGGIPATTIPKYRLPQDVLQIDVKWILAHGIELKKGVQIGKDKTIDDLLREDFKAVLIATGLSLSRILPLPGADHKRVFSVLQFLSDQVKGGKIDLGDNVVVIGGGNVACDAARTAIRLGAAKVKMMCLESAEEMPAFKWEIAESVEEGAEIINRRGPVEIVVEDGRITGLKARKVTRVFDDSKRFSPEYDDSDVAVIDCDTVIFAIGQMPDFDFLTGSSVKRNSSGRLDFNPATHQSNVENVFACGEIVTPPGSVVEACANGKRAAEAMDMYLSGKKIKLDGSLPYCIDKIAEVTAEKVIKVERVKVPTRQADERIKDFDEFEHNLDTDGASFEARRCMNCGSGAEVLIDKCAVCLTCLRVCPFDIPKVTDVARIDSSLCQACGICISECPANAIVARGREKYQLANATADALKASKDRGVIAYICGHNASVEQWLGGGDSVPGVTKFFLPSLARLSVLEILSAFENGAKAVLILSCQNGSERYPNANKRTAKRVAQAKQMLSEIGLDAEKLQMITIDDESIDEVLIKAVKELNI